MGLGRAWTEMWKTHLWATDVVIGYGLNVQVYNYANIFRNENQSQNTVIIVILWKLQQYFVFWYVFSCKRENISSRIIFKSNFLFAIHKAKRRHVGIRPPCLYHHTDNNTVVILAGRVAQTKAQSCWWLNKNQLEYLFFNNAFSLREGYFVLDCEGGGVSF